MSTSPFSPEEIRAAAEAHRELGTEYHDAVVESFLAKIEREIDARVDARLANSPLPARRRELDPATLAKRRLMLQHMAVGSVVTAVPLSLIVLAANPWDQSRVRAAFVLVWILIGAVYAVASALLRPSRRDRE
jgi:hypothetical protein